MKRLSKLHHLAVAIGLFLLIAPDAAMAQKKYATFGAGAATCAIFANHYKTEPMIETLSYFSWAQGYMTALNMTFVANNKETVDLRDYDSQTRHIRQYCDQHPLKDYSDAVLDLFEAMAKKQGLLPYPAQ